MTNGAFIPPDLGKGLTPSNATQHSQQQQTSRNEDNASNATQHIQQQTSRNQDNAAEPFPGTSHHAAASRDRGYELSSSDDEA